jgi:pectate lyase C
MRRYFLAPIYALVAVALMAALLAVASTASSADTVNLSLDAGSDGSSKASGTSYSNVRDGDLETYWSPSDSTGRISIKWSSDVTVSSVVIREASGSEGTIGSWELKDHDSGDVLASGSGVGGTISFSSTSLRKISFHILSASGTPRVAEFETYGSSDGGDGATTTTTVDDGGGTTTTVDSGDSGEITGASCSPNGSVSVSSTIRVGAGETYDGQCRVHNVTFGDGSQDENQDPVIRVEDGGTVRNVIIGNNGADGIHTYGDVLVENVTWQNVGEDALTIKDDGNVTVRNIEGYDAEDKFFQVNAPSTLNVDNCIIDNAGKALRQNGGTTFEINVTFNRCRIVDMNEGVFRTDSNSSTAHISNSELRNARPICIGNWASCTESNVSG